MQLHSHLFTVRIWQEELGADQVEWRGRVQLATSGDVRYFRGWAALEPLLRVMLSESPVKPASDSEEDAEALPPRLI